MSWKSLTEEEQEWIDKEKWGEDLDLANEEDVNEKTTTGHILHCIRYYQNKEFEDYRLWEYF